MNIILYVFVFFVCIYGVCCLRNVRLMFPESVPEGGNATLYCWYDLENEPLYSVKWYRGSHEIFRYHPREIPRTRVFLVPGLYIDIHSSSSHKLVLLDVPKNLGGNFTCEVSAEEPMYTTRYDTKFLTVTPRNKTTEELAHENYSLLNINANYLKLNSTSSSNYLNINYVLINVILYILWLLK